MSRRPRERAWRKPHAPTPVRASTHGAPPSCADAPTGGANVLMVGAMEIVEADPVTGKKTPLVATARRALRALNRAEIPYAVIGATALGVRGLARFTADLDIVVVEEDAFPALCALDAAGFAAEVDVDRDAPPEAMYVMRHGKGEVDVLVAFAEPESTVVAEAPRAR